MSRLTNAIHVVKELHDRMCPSHFCCEEEQELVEQNIIGTLEYMNMLLRLSPNIID